MSRWKSLQTLRSRVELDSGRRLDVVADTVTGIEATLAADEGSRRVAMTGGSMSELLGRARTASAWEGADDGFMRALADPLPDGGLALDDEVAAAHEILAVARELLASAPDTRVAIASNAVDIRVVAPAAEPLSASRRTARVSMKLAVATEDGMTEARASACVPGTLRTIEHAQLRATVEMLRAQAARLALSRSTPQYEGPVVFSPEAAGVLAHEAVAHLLEADNYMRLVDSRGRLGHQLASPEVSAVERGRARDRWGSVGVDDEGVETEDVELLVEGSSAALVTDSAWAQRLGKTPSSGHGRHVCDTDPIVPRFSRIELLAGQASADALLARARDAIYVDSLSHAWLDTRTGSISLKIREAHGVEAGQITRCYSGGTVEAQAVDLLSNIVAVASDVQWRPSLCLKRGKVTAAENGAPTTLVSGIVIQ